MWQGHLISRRMLWGFFALWVLHRHPVGGFASQREVLEQEAGDSVLLSLFIWHNCRWHGEWDAGVGRRRNYFTPTEFYLGNVPYLNSWFGSFFFFLMCSVSVLFLCLFPSCRAISRLEQNRLLTSKKRLGRWEVFVFSCQKHSTELVWKASPLLVALLVKSFKEQRWLQGSVSPSVHLKSSPSAVAHLSCYQYLSERTLILFLLLLLLFLLFFIYNVETSLLTSWVFWEGECSQSLLVLCRSPALCFFFGGVGYVSVCKSQCRYWADSSEGVAVLQLH